MSKLNNLIMPVEFIFLISYSFPVRPELVEGFERVF